MLASQGSQTKLFTVHPSVVSWGILQMSSFTLRSVLFMNTDGIHCRQSLAGPCLSILQVSSKPLVIASWEHSVLLWFFLWSVWIGANLWELCRLTMSEAFTAGRFGILSACGHQASFHKEVKGSEVWHSLFLTNLYCLAVAWLLFHMHLQREFYKNYPNPFPGLSWLTRIPLFLNTLCLSHYSLGLFPVFCEFSESNAHGPSWHGWLLEYPRIRVISCCQLEFHQSPLTTLACSFNLTWFVNFWVR